MMNLRSLLEHPLTRGLDLDAPETSSLRRQIIQEKRFLFRLYEEWYYILAAVMPGVSRGPALELGTGGGFLPRYIPNLIASEVLPLAGVDVLLNGLALPFPENSLRGIVMTNVFHHLPDAGQFLKEAGRCLIPGGVLAMVEPWVTSWSTWVYTRLHHEPFDPQASSWRLPAGGPLSNANGALPWIVFKRDRALFEQTCPELRVRQIMPLMPFRYLASGGVSLRSLSPEWSFDAWRGFENMLGARKAELAMFAGIVVVKKYS
jgi:SAM-dependent methyltransferase